MLIYVLYKLLKIFTSLHANTPGTDVHNKHMHQFLTRMCISFPIFQVFILYTLSRCVKNWCLHCAYLSRTDACTEHMHQEMMPGLSIYIKNWCMHWAYASGTNMCTEHTYEIWNGPFKTCRTCAAGTDAYPEHVHQKLMCLLSIHVRNWCVSWAYASVCLA